MKSYAAATLLWRLRRSVKRSPEAAWVIGGAAFTVARVSGLRAGSPLAVLVAVAAAGTAGVWYGPRGTLSDMKRIWTVSPTSAPSASSRAYLLIEAT
jgi:hypothetical protein